MTNFEKIKAMSVEEMAEFIENEAYKIDPCNYCENYSLKAPHCTSLIQSVDCRKATMKYLESEVEEDG